MVPVSFEYPFSRFKFSYFILKPFYEVTLAGDIAQLNAGERIASFHKMSVAVDKAGQNQSLCRSTLLVSGPMKVLISLVRPTEII